MRQDGNMSKEENNLMHNKVKEDDGGDDGHKITINRCDGDGWQCAIDWRTVPVNTMMTTMTTTKTTLSGLQTMHPLHFPISAGTSAAQQTRRRRQRPR
jgi:hypothetical protein